MAEAEGAKTPPMQGDIASPALLASWHVTARILLSSMPAPTSAMPPEPLIDANSGRFIAYYLGVCELGRPNIGQVGQAACDNVALR